MQFIRNNSTYANGQSFDLFRINVNRLKPIALVLALFVLFTFTIYPLLFSNTSSSISHDNALRSKNLTFTRASPLIFVGGIPRSGTTLMRVILDSHLDIRCGEETHIIPRFIANFEVWYSKSWKAHLIQAGLTDETMLRAASNYILDLIVSHGEPARVLCNKDPLVLMNTPLVHSMFPNAKFLLMIRDGRAVVHSVISRSINIRNFNTSSQATTLASWNENIEKMVNGCLSVGPKFCMMVFYEQLVLHPENTTKAVCKFLNIKWTPDLLRHEEFVGKPGGISLSSMEYSTNQVVKPINLEGLTSWVNFLEPAVRKETKTLAPMLQKLGYDVESFKPNYGTPDAFVQENSKRISREKKLWSSRMYETLNRIKTLKPTSTYSTKSTVHSSV